MPEGRLRQSGPEGPCPDHLGDGQHAVAQDLAGTVNDERVVRGPLYEIREKRVLLHEFCDLLVQE